MEQDLGHLFITSSSFYLNKIDLKQCLFKAIIPHSPLATNLVVKTPRLSISILYTPYAISNHTPNLSNHHTL